MSTVRQRERAARVLHVSRYARVARIVSRLYIVESVVEPAIIGCLIGVVAAGFSLAFTNAERLGAYIRSLIGSFWLFLSFALIGAVAFTLSRLYGWHEGSSTNKFLEYFHFEYGRIPLAAALALILGAIVSVAAGASIGPEGPALILGGFLGYEVAKKLFHKPAYEAKSYTLIGAGAAVAAVFKAPLTAMTFVLEVLYQRDLETSVFLETIVATIAAYLTCVTLTGPGGIFVHGFGGPLLPTTEDIIVGLIAGVVTAGLSYLMIEAKKAFAKLAQGLCRVSVMAGPLILATLLWLSSVRHPFVLGGGEHVAIEALHRQLKLSCAEAFWASIEKSILTVASLTLGATGGIFLPLVTIGSLLGYSLALLLNSKNIEVFILASVAGMFAGTNSVVISAVLFGVEVLGGHAFIPSALAASISYLLSMGSSLHTNQLPRREVAKKLALAELLHRVSRNPELLKRLEKIKAIDVANKNVVKLRADMGAYAALHFAARKGHIAYPVVEDDDRLIGYVELEDLVAVEPGTLVKELVREPPVVKPDTPIIDVAALLIRRDIDRVFVVDDQFRLKGILTKTDLLKTIINIYESMLEEEHVS